MSKAPTAQQQASLSGLLISPSSERESGQLWIGAAAFGAGVLCMLAVWFLLALRGRSTPRPGFRTDGMARTCLDSLPDIVVIFRLPDERIMAANAAACELYGLGPEEMTARTLSELERLVPLGKDQISRTIALGTSPSFVSRQVRPDGTQVSLEITASVIDFGGERCVLSVGHDVSERDQAAERAAREFGAYRELFESWRDAVLVTDAESQSVVAANGAATALFDPGARGLVGGPISRLLPGEEMDAPAQRTAAVRLDASSWVRMRIERSESSFRGRRALVYRCVALAFGGSGVSEEDGGEELDVFDHVMEALVVVDPASREVIRANRAAKRLYGYEGDEFIGVATDRLTTDPQGCREICASVLREGPRSGEPRFHRRKDGSMIAVEANFSPIPCDGKSCILCSMRQISPSAMRGYPIFAAECAPDQQRAGSADGLSEPKPLPRGGHVLVVDDEPLVREVTRRMLESKGYRVTMAPDGASAIACVTSDASITSVVLDVTMPGMLGPEVKSLMLNARPSLRVVLCSGYSSDAVMGEGAAPGDASSDVFVQKPFTIEALMAAIGGADVNTGR